MDLYRLLGVPLASEDLSVISLDKDEDSEPQPWTLLTKVVETTDEPGLIAACARVTP